MDACSDRLPIDRTGKAAPIIGARPTFP